MKYFLPALAFGLLLTGCVSSPSNSSTPGNSTSTDPYATETTTTTTSSTAPTTTSPTSTDTMNTPDTSVAAASLGADQLALETNMGTIIIQLQPDAAPKNAKNVYDLAAAGKYDGTLFHRVIEGFMIQGGDYENGNGTGGQAFTGGTLNDEINPAYSHVRGTVAMANRGPNTNGSQFYIVQQDSTFLDGGYTIIGKVVSGMDTVDAIAAVETGAADRPVQDVTITAVRTGVWED